MTASPVFALADRYVEQRARLDPVQATFLGVRGHDGEITDMTPEGHAARAELDRATLRELEGQPVSSDDDRVAASHLRERLEAQLAWYDAGEALRMLRGAFGVAMSIRGSVEMLPRQSEEEWADVAARLAGVPTMVEGWRESLEAGLDAGTPVARRQAVEAAAQLATWAGDGDARPTHDATVEAYAGGGLASALTTAAAQAHAAYSSMARWLRTEYAPRAAEREAVGADRYAVAARMTLGTTLDAREAYAWGWSELRRIETEIAREADRVLPGASPQEAGAHLNETYRVDGEEAYLAWLQDRHDEAVERLDGAQFDIAGPLRRVEVRLAPPGSSAAAYYTGPSEDFSRPGRTWWPVSGRTSFGVWDELTTVFHEGVPGHHLQKGQAVLARDRLSRFSRSSFVSGHGEGWALYAERLADELGWLAHPGERLGYLSSAARRAARVVIDIGVHLELPLPPDEAARHGERWTFDVACDVLANRGHTAPHMVHSEVVRYFGWPAQAPSYKLGERVWLAARDDARARLGPAFDLKAWHTSALNLGPLGLATLEEELRRWDGSSPAPILTKST